MSKPKWKDKLQTLVELRQQAAELADEIAAVEDDLKAVMRRQGVDKLQAGRHVVRWNTVQSNRFDSKAFRTECPDMYAAYTRPTECRRFTVA